MGKSLLIVGSGGQGKVALDCAVSLGVYEEIAFHTNDGEAPDQIGGYGVIREDAQSLEEALAGFDEVFVAVGDNEARERISSFCEGRGASLATLIHPRSYVSSFAEIGRGSIIMPHATVNVFASVGVGCIVNTNAVVEHDCILGSFVHLSPSAVLGGGAVVGDRSWLCLGSCVRDHIVVGADIVIGANSCVLRDVNAPGTYVGSPVRLL